MSRKYVLWTKVRRELFLEVVKFTKENNGLPPSMDALVKKTGRVKSHVYHDLNNLVEAGFLAWNRDAVKRSKICVVGGSWQYTPPGDLPPDVVEDLLK